MMPAADTPRSTGFTLDEAAHTIRFVRDFAASPSQVFAAWTMPEHLVHWWDSTGKPLTGCEVDLRIGGTFTFTVQDYPEMPFVGVYREIVPGELLRFDALGAAGSVLLARKADGGTAMTVEIVAPNKALFDQFVQMGVQVGTAGTLDNLVAYLGRTATT